MSRKTRSGRHPLALAVSLAALACSGCASLGQAKQGPAAALAAADAQRLAKSQAALAVMAAETAEQQGNAVEAIRLYEQARLLDPECNHLCRRLAVLYDQNGDDPSARSAYELAIALKPDEPDLLNDFGVFHFRREQWPEAEMWFRQALKVDPCHQRGTVNLGMCLAMQGRLHESYDLFSRVAGPAAAWSNIGVLLARQGRLAEAREHFLRALAIDRELEPARKFLACLERAPGQSVHPAGN